MFDRAIIDTDRFMDLSMSSKALYFLLGMEADDEGFVSYKKVMRVHGGNEDDIKVLIAKGFLIKFESGVVVITDWHKNNWLDNRRIKPTEYTFEKSLLAVSSTKEYLLSDRLAFASLEESSIEENRVVESRGEKKRIEEKTSELSSQDNDVNKIFDVFYNTINPTINYGNTTSRKAAKFMIDKWGVDAVVAMTEYACSIHGQPYAPTVTTPYQLKEKLSAIKAFKDRQETTQTSNVLKL